MLSPACPGSMSTGRRNSSNPRKSRLDRRRPGRRSQPHPHGSAAAPARFAEKRIPSVPIRGWRVALRRASPRLPASRSRTAPASAPAICTSSRNQRHPRHLKPAESPAPRSGRLAVSVDLRPRSQKDPGGQVRRAAPELVELMKALSAPDGLRSDRQRLGRPGTGDLGRPLAVQRLAEGPLRAHG